MTKAEMKLCQPREGSLLPYLLWLKILKSSGFAVLAFGFIYQGTMVVQLYEPQPYLLMRSSLLWSPDVSHRPAMTAGLHSGIDSPCTSHRAVLGSIRHKTFSNCSELLVRPFGRKTCRCSPRESGNAPEGGFPERTPNRN